MDQKTVDKNMQESKDKLVGFFKDLIKFYLDEPSIYPIDGLWERITKCLSVENAVSAMLSYMWQTQTNEYSVKMDKFIGNITLKIVTHDDGNIQALLTCKYPEATKEDYLVMNQILLDQGFGS